jgi:flagellar biosynthesis repressor protein FlbT
MGLHIKLRPNERLVLNGCVIKNGDRASSIEIENRADVLRGSEILDAEECNTPVSRVQNLIQVALVSADRRAALVPEILERLEEIGQAMAASSTQDIIGVSTMVREGDFYRAFKGLICVAEREKLLLALSPSEAAQQMGVRT